MPLDPALQAMVDNETLRHISSHGGEHEYVIDPFRHRELTAIGWQTIIYLLIVRDSPEEDESRYEINEESEHQGGDNLLTTDDSSEVVFWIGECLERV
jgi:hypothetical protein